MARRSIGGPGTNQYGVKPKKAGWLDDVAEKTPATDSSGDNDPMDAGSIPLPANSIVDDKRGWAQLSTAGAVDTINANPNSWATHKRAAAAMKDLDKASADLATAIAWSPVPPTADLPALQVKGLKGGDSVKARLDDADTYGRAAYAQLKGKPGLTAQQQVDRLATAQDLINKCKERLEPVPEMAAPKPTPQPAAAPGQPAPMSPARAARKNAQAKIGSARKTLDPSLPAAARNAAAPKAIADLKATLEAIAESRKAIGYGPPVGTQSTPPAGWQGGNTPEELWADASRCAAAAETHLQGRSGLTVEQKREHLALAFVYANEAAARLESMPKPTA
jgi:hypothetical protein